jgi:hypothetical protein
MMTLLKTLREINQKDHNTIHSPQSSVKSPRSSQGPQSKNHSYQIPWLLVHQLQLQLGGHEVNIAVEDNCPLVS